MNDELLSSFVETLAVIRKLYRKGIATISSTSKNSGVSTARETWLEQSHAGLLIKTYVSFALADQRWQPQERPLAAALFKHLWGVSLADEDLKQAMMQINEQAKQITWYSVLRPFVELRALAEYGATLEGHALRLAKLIAAVDGPLQPAELAQLQSFQQELETHLHPLVLEDGDERAKTGHSPTSHARSVSVPEQCFSPPEQVAKSKPATTAAAPTPRHPDLNTLLRELHDLIGLTPIKHEVQTLVNLIRFQHHRSQSGLPTTPLSLHTVFTGNPGTGKTTVARLLGNILRGLDILASGHVMETDRAGLVADYAGQTASKTNRLIDSALDGILFIDEAYSLAASDQDSYGKEALQILLKRMEDDRHRLVVVLAGYAEPMQRMLLSNPGLSSRFCRYFDFADYTPLELLAIFRRFCDVNHYEAGPLVQARLLSGFTLLYTRRDQHFGNARLARNLFEQAVRLLANRVASVSDVSRESLITFSPQDIVFDELSDQDVNKEQRHWKAGFTCPHCTKRLRSSMDALQRGMACPACRKPILLHWRGLSWKRDDGS